MEVTARVPSLLLINQAHPDPNLVRAALAKASFMESRLPKEEVMASAKFPCGRPPPCGERHFQKKVWFE